MVEISPIAYAFFGAVFGSLGTFVVGEVRDYRRRKREREDLRIALYQEIAGNDTTEYLQTGHVPNPSELSIPSQIFDSNSSKIGLLSEEEIRNVVAYYSRATNLRNLLSLVNAASETETDDEQRLKALDLISGQVVAGQLRALAIIAKESDKITLPDMQITDEISDIFGFALEEGEIPSGKTVYEHPDLQPKEVYSQMITTLRDYEIE